MGAYRAVGTWGLAAVMAFAAVESAAAQEAPPVPLSIAFSDSSDEPVAVRVRDSGFVVRAPDGSWRLMCAAALAVSASSNFYIEGLPGDRLLVTHFNGLQHGDESFCEWSYPDADLEGIHVAAVDAHGDTLYALTTKDNQYSIFRSDDRAESFEPISELADGVAFFGLRVAPSDPERIYLSAAAYDVDSGVSTRLLYRSDDGGQSYLALDLELGQASNTQLLAVDPSDPDRVYIAFAAGVSSHSHGEEMHSTDALLVSQDAGESWTTLRELGVFGGLAVGPGADELWLGDAEGGLLRSTDRGESFTEIDANLRASCVQVHDERVWVCGDSARDPDAFSLGYTDDAGESFTPVMRFDQVAGLLECGGAPIGACNAAWAGWTFWNALGDAGVAGTPPAAPGDTDIDAGASPAPGSRSDAGAASDDTDDTDDGCSCRVARSEDASSATLILLALVALSRRRR